MQRDVLLLTEMIDAAEQAQQLATGVRASELEAYRRRRDALLWNFTVLVLHTTATDQLPAFTADLRRVLTALSVGGSSTTGTPGTGPGPVSG
jgi:hypothetical protein